MPLGVQQKTGEKARGRVAGINLRESLGQRYAGWWWIWMGRVRTQIGDEPQLVVCFDEIYFETNLVLENVAMKSEPARRSRGDQLWGNYSILSPAPKCCRAVLFLHA